MPNYDHLHEQLKAFEDKLEIRKATKETHHKTRLEELADLEDTLEEKTNAMISKIEELKRKETILLTLGRIEPQVPEQFPKNYYMQIVYEDAVLTGNQKFVDFDENIVDEKFVLPLLFTTIVKVEIWAAEQEPVLFDRGDINLERDIQNAIVSDRCEGEVAFQKLPETRLTYGLQIQGIGFASWLKNLGEMRELEQEKFYSHEQIKLKKDETRRKLQVKKREFAEKFKKPIGNTIEYSSQSVDEILQSLRGE